MSLDKGLSLIEYLSVCVLKREGEEGNFCRYVSRAEQLDKSKF